MTNEKETPTPQQEETETPASQQDEVEIPATQQEETDAPAPQQEETETPLPQQEETEKIPEDTVTFKRSNLYTMLIIMYAVLVPLVLAAGFGGGYLIWGQDSGSSTVNATQPQPDNAQPTTQAANPAETGAPEVPREITRYDVSIDDDPILGPEDASITIIEFSDFECPYCRRWHQEVLPQLIEDYPDQVRLVYRDFPLTSIHANAVPAAIAANCAAEQDGYWEFNELLFNSEQGLSSDAYQQYAEEIGLDMESFTECLDSNRYEDEVLADFEFASQLGIRSTPTFFINGIALVGAQPYEVFKQVIDQELAGELD
jgi:protein-disulfide isomerase